jgi:UDP-N-acetylglucosamine transferase subunit ALG13
MAEIKEPFSPGPLLGAFVMIFVTVGNWHKGFDRLIRAVDDLVIRGVIGEDVIGQIGYGEFRPSRIQWFQFCSPEQCESYVQQSRMVIAHAGMGTIALAGRYGKPILVLPRRADLGEIHDNHQHITACQLAQEGRLLVVDDTATFPELLKRAEHFVPTASQTSPELISKIEQFLVDVSERKRRV